MVDGQSSTIGYNQQVGESLGYIAWGTKNLPPDDHEEGIDEPLGSIDVRITIPGPLQYGVTNNNVTRFHLTLHRIYINCNLLLVGLYSNGLHEMIIVFV